MRQGALFSVVSGGKRDGWNKYHNFIIYIYLDFPQICKRKQLSFKKDSPDIINLDNHIL